jgi:hypothetical protein
MFYISLKEQHIRDCSRNMPEVSSFILYTNISPFVYISRETCKEFPP